MSCASAVPSGASASQGCCCLWGCRGHKPTQGHLPESFQEDWELFSHVK